MMNRKLARKLLGKFVVLDGIDACGKGTQLQLLRREMHRCDIDPVTAKDPGSTAVGEAIRELLLHSGRKMTRRCETMLFMAARAQLVAEVIEPALHAGRAVLCDRFVSSTCAYQSDEQLSARKIVEIASAVVGRCWPHLTIIIDIPAEEAFRRLGRGLTVEARTGQQHLPPADAAHDSMESRPLEFFHKVRRGFLSLPGEYPSRVEIVDGLGSPAAVAGRIEEVLERVFS